MLKQYLIKATSLNIIVKILNYFYYLLVTLYLGYGLQTDSIFYLEGMVSLTLLLPLQLFNFTLIPKLTKDSENFSQNFSTMLFILFFWTFFWFLIYKFFLLELFSLFYPGLKAANLQFFKLNLDYILLFVSLSLFTNVMSISLDAIYKHTLVYKILLLKSLTALSVLYLFHEKENVLFLVLCSSILVEFLSLLYSYRKKIVFKVNISFFTSQLYDLKYIILFASTGMLFGIIDRYYISYLEDGNITILKYATLIIGMVSSLIPLSRILYPYLSKSSQEEQLKLFTKVMKIVIAIYTPLLLFVIIFPDFIPSVLFGYGKVTSYEIHEIGTILIFLVLTALLGILIGILDKILFLQKLYRALFYRLLATLIINGIGNYLSVFVFGWGLEGIVFFTMLVHIYILYSSYMIIKKDTESIKDV